MIVETKTDIDPNLEFAKVVVDIEKEILSYNCELHIDCYDELVKAGSDPKNLWGANVNLKSGAIFFTSMINIKPPEYRTMEIKDEVIKNKVETVIKKIIF